MHCDVGVGSSVARCGAGVEHRDTYSDTYSDTFNDTVNDIFDDTDSDTDTDTKTYTNAVLDTDSFFFCVPIGHSDGNDVYTTVMDSHANDVHNRDADGVGHAVA